jgi:hypothetical protein
MMNIYYHHNIFSYSSITTITFYDTKCNILSMEKSICYLCNSTTFVKICPTCSRPACKNCMKSFPFSANVCLECAVGVKTGLAGIRKDEEIF